MMKTDFKNRWVEELSALGSLPFYFVVVAGSLWILGFWAALRLLAGLAFTMAIAYAVRLLHFRERPRPAGYGNMVEKLDASSFPSTHAARAGLLFALLPLPKSFLFVIMVLVCTSRVLLGKHHGVDVIAGALLGVLAGSAV